jgi:hypothetical protein
MTTAGPPNTPTGCTATLTAFRVTMDTVQKQEVLHMLIVSRALAIKHATRMRRILLSCVACLAVPCFSTLSHKRHDFRGWDFNEHKICRLEFITNLMHNFI